MITSDGFVGRRVTLERTLVCAQAGQFPVLARGAGGELAAVFRAGAAHYGLHGTLATACSDDGGRTWSAPIEVAPRGHDVRNPAFAITGGGRWLLAYWQAGLHAYPDGKWQLPAGDIAAPDLFVIDSGDRGRTWSAPRPYRSATRAWCSPFGRIVDDGGTLVMAAYGPPRGGGGGFDAIAIRSADGGATWGDESRVCADASELSLCAVGDELVGAVRRGDGHTAIVRSRDRGRTWSPPAPVTRTLEHPADLCVLRGSGRLLLTFGRRRRPLGCAALVSADGGLTWDREREVLLAGDGIGNDVGYPSTVQRDDGGLVTVVYFARGSAAAEPADGWGELSCQALHYPEALVAG